MRLVLVPAILAIAFWCGACVKGPLVDFGPRDKPLVDVKIGGGDDQAPAKKDGKKPPSRSDDSRSY
jgi:hypothetical protein